MITYVLPYYLFGDDNLSSDKMSSAMTQQPKRSQKKYAFEVKKEQEVKKEYDSQETVPATPAELRMAGLLTSEKPRWKRGVLRNHCDQAPETQKVNKETLKAESHVEKKEARYYLPEKMWL